MSLATLPSRRSPWDPGPAAPWEMQAGEGSKAHAAFCAYRELEPNERSLRNVSRVLQKDYGLIARWSGTWRWVARCLAGR
jgi:hypothetical protein